MIITLCIIIGICSISIGFYFAWRKVMEVGSPLEVCPECKKSSTEEIEDGKYRCDNCGKEFHREEAPRKVKKQIWMSAEDIAT